MNLWTARGNSWPFPAFRAFRGKNRPILPTKSSRRQSSVKERCNIRPSCPSRSSCARRRPSGLKRGRNLRDWIIPMRRERPQASRWTIGLPGLRQRRAFWKSSCFRLSYRSLSRPSTICIRRAFIRKAERPCGNRKSAARRRRFRSRLGMRKRLWTNPRTSCRRA